MNCLRELSSRLRLRDCTCREAANGYAFGSGCSHLAIQSLCNSLPSSDNRRDGSFPLASAAFPGKSSLLGSGTGPEHGSGPGVTPQGFAPMTRIAIAAMLAGLVLLA